MEPQNWKCIHACKHVYSTHALTHPGFEYVRYVDIHALKPRKGTYVKSKYLNFPVFLKKLSESLTHFWQLYQRTNLCINFSRIQGKTWKNKSNTLILLKLGLLTKVPSLCIKWSTEHQICQFYKVLKLKRDYFWNYLLFVLLLIYRLFCVVCDEVLFFLVFMYLEDWDVTLPGLERTNVDPTGLKLPSLCPVSGRIRVHYHIWLFYFSGTVVM